MGLVAQWDLQTYGLISTFIQQSSLTYVKSNWKTPSYKKDMKSREPTLLHVEYTISTPGSSSQATW